MQRPLCFLCYFMLCIYIRRIYCNIYTAVPRAISQVPLFNIDMGVNIITVLKVLLMDIANRYTFSSFDIARD